MVQGALPEILRGALEIRPVALLLLPCFCIIFVCKIGRVVKGQTSGSDRSRGRVMIGR